MKRLLFVLCGSALLAGAADLETVKTIFVLPMSHGLDQFLVNRITNEHVLRVVTDPKMADVILTDRVGEGLQAKLEALFPNPEPEKPADEEDARSQNPFLQGAAKTAPTPSGSFSRISGMVFLVDTKSRQIVWSTFEPGKGTGPKYLDRSATEIVARLKKDIKHQ